MATSSQTRFREVPAEESEERIQIEQRVQAPPLEETIAERDRMLGVITGYRRGELTQAELPTDVHTYPGRIMQGSPPSDELQLVQEHFKEGYLPEQNGEKSTSGEGTPDRIQMLTRGRELLEQERFADVDPATQWTLQQYSTNPAGEPWFVLQKQDESGQLRTVTGTREELNNVIAEHGLKPLELPPVTEGTYYRQAIGGVELSPEVRREESLGVAV